MLDGLVWRTWRFGCFRFCVVVLLLVGARQFLCCSSSLFQRRWIICGVCFVIIWSSSLLLLLPVEGFSSRLWLFLVRVSWLMFLWARSFCSQGSFRFESNALKGRHSRSWMTCRNYPNYANTLSLSILTNISLKTWCGSDFISSWVHLFTLPYLPLIYGHINSLPYLP